ncbi:MAG TPA: cellulase family glycosylhydrolase [Mycobacteriales bacterium]|nr:cellulase family glycosylhydrolase [Mycobacteriales bacterium]HWA68005.1 cellulase family glycosylhydrolase [Mycobacteriales bacterium]
MPFRQARHEQLTRRRLVTVAGLLALLAAVAAPAVPRAAAAASLSISIKGNHFVDGTGKTVQLRGVDEISTEYWCTFGFSTGTPQYATYTLPAEAKYIASWHANAVRIPLNEDCWLGLNGEPAWQGDTAAGYRQAIEGFVKDVNAQHMYAILDLHWSANGSTQSKAQAQLGDDHSVAFWKSVAGAFKSDHAVIFDAFNEPVSQPGAPISWACWRNGGCPVSSTYGSTAHTYPAVGMQALVSAIRSAGATEPIMLGGLNWANDLSGWLANEPKDTLRPAQLAASYHNYEGSSCATTTCWNTTITSVASKVPVVTGEFGQFACQTTFDTQWMDWADAHGVSYLAWAFVASDKGSPSCGQPGYGPDLLTPDLSSPQAPNGTQVYNHLTKFPKP